MSLRSTSDTNGCSYESPTMGRCGAPIGAHYKDSGHGPILYHSFVPPTSTVATKDAEQRGSAEARLVHAIRHADKAFERVGGSTRHYVRDCLIPEMQEQHICVVDADEIERLRELEAKWKPIVSRAVGIFNQQEQHRDFVPSIWAQRVAEYIVNGGDRA